MAVSMVSRLLPLLLLLDVNSAADVLLLRSLRSERCNTTQCPPPKNHELWQISCEYSCLGGERYYCVENKEAGTSVIEFCTLPSALNCPKGYRGSFEVDAENPNQIIMKEEKCPNGTYQSHTSDCIHACRRKPSLDFLPKSLKVHSFGDHVEPATVYCDYMNSYYNTKNVTFFKYEDDFFLVHFDFCVNNINPCTDGLIVLPNGTCTVPCKKGEVRDIDDWFICKSLSGSVSSPPTDYEITDKGTDRSFFETDKTTKRVTENQTTPGPASSISTEAWIGIAFGIIGAIVVIGCIIFMVWRWRKNKERETLQDDDNGGQGSGIELQETDTSDSKEEKNDEPLLQENGATGVEAVEEVSRKKHPRREKRNKANNYNKTVNKNGTTEHHYHAKNMTVYTSPPASQDNLQYGERKAINGAVYTGLNKGCSNQVTGHQRTTSQSSDVSVD